jgi:hypothetical protein
LFGDSWASFFVTDSLVQDQPDQPTLSMGNRTDGLVMSQARDGAAIHNVEDTSFGPGCGVGRLVENAPHVAVALRRSVAVVPACALIVAGACTTPGGETFLGRKGRRSKLTHKLAVHEKEMIEASLRKSEGRVSGPSGAAAKLGISRSTLESKIRSLKINKNRFRA